MSQCVAGLACANSNKSAASIGTPSSLWKPSHRPFATSKRRVLIGAAVCVMALTASTITVAVEPLASPSIRKCPECAHLPTAEALAIGIREAAEHASPGLVTVYSMRGPRMTRPWRLREEAKNQSELAHASLKSFESSLIVSPDDQGSGIVIDRKGYVLTCNHVVEGADALFVRTADGRKYNPKQVWCDPVSDLALIRIENADELCEAELGDSDDVEVGDWVVSVASPYGMEQSISAGIVSKTNRRVASSPYPLIQDDAATNPGSSGGALVNMDGQVVGVIIGGFTTTGEFQGIGLAIPINTAMQVSEQLRTKGQVPRGYLGFQMQMLTPGMAKLLDVPTNNGLYVCEVDEASPAGRAGIQTGDIVVQVDGKQIDESFDPQALYDDGAINNEHAFSLLRDHQTIVKQVIIGQSPRDVPQLSGFPEMQASVDFDYFDNSLGLGLRNLNSSESQELQLPHGTKGVLISYVSKGSLAYIEGLAAGMAIVRMNDQAIKSLDDYQRVRPEPIRDSPVVMLVQSDQGKYLVMVGNNEENQQ